MLIVIVAALLGVWRFRSAEYFKWLGIAFVWMLAAGFLFSGGGTLDDPSGDGLIAHQVRIATDDGPGMALFAIVFLVAYWGGLLFCIIKMRKAARELRDNHQTTFGEAGYVDEASSARKVVETAAILGAASLWISTMFGAATTQHSQPSSQTAKSTEVVAQRSIEQQLIGVATELNKTLPQQVDEETRLEKVSVLGRTFTYHYRVQAASNQREDLRRFVLQTVVPKVCESNMRGDIRDDGVIYKYSYVSENFSAPVEAVVSEAICLELEG